MSQNTAKNYSRLLEIPSNYSFFLFGPRGVGKTTLLNQALPTDKTLKLDLLDNQLSFKLKTDRTAFKEIISQVGNHIEWIYIDEIQTIPSLLNEIHQLIETNKKLKFALTGSSARQLKTGKANLLAGRAFTLNLYPLTIRELGDDFLLNSVLQFGTLPKIFEFDSDVDKQDFLAAYVNTYLKEEIAAEGIVRRLPAFTNFLQLAAASNGEILSFNNIARDVGINARSISAYYQILEDTLLGFRLLPYHRSIRKKQRGTPKFYFFDPGVVRSLQRLSRIELLPQTIEYGRAFEHLIITEIIRENHYRKADYKFSYFATPHSEIDLIVEKPSGETLLIEIKSSNNIKPKHYKNLKNLLPNFKDSCGIIVSREQYARQITDKVSVCPWQEVVQRVFE